MTLLLDYSAGKIPGAAIKAAGYAGSIRYITDRNSLGTKHTSPAEYADHVANGLEVFLVYEVNTDDPLSGYAGGVTAAQRALDGAAFIGYPSYKPIFLAFDRHVSATNYASEIAAWRSYLDGGASVLSIGRTGAYGFSEALAAAQGHATSFWQCGSRSALLANANLYQRNTGSVVVGGIECDVNDVLIPLANSGSATGASAQSTEEFDMPDRELRPSANGSVTLTVPADATTLEISVGWTSMTVTKVDFVGPTGATGVNRLASYGSQHVDAERPYALPVPAGAVTCEVNYILNPVPGRDVSGTAGFRK